jgi:hypothetical protein
MRAALPLLAAMLLAGCAAPPPEAPANGTAPPTDAPTPQVNATLPPKFAHEHAAFALFLAGERVAFNDTAYDLSRVGQVRAHLHVTERDGGSIVHVEGAFPGGVPNVTLQEFLAIHGVRFAPPSLTLDAQDHHNGTTWNDTAAVAWQVWLQPGRNASWEPAAPGLLLRDGQRVLLTYAPLGSAEIAAQQGAVPEPPRLARP